MTASDLPRRAAALALTRDWLSRRTFDWHESDCLAMLAVHLAHNGHGIVALPPYRSALGAKRALGKAGFADLGAAIDSVLPRIAPAMMLPGDVALVPGDPEGLGGTGIDALVVSFGRKAMGWTGGLAEAVVMTVSRMDAAWRVEPR